MLCSYGCGREGIYKFLNGKFCCEKSINSCPVIRKKNSESAKKKNKFTVNANTLRKECEFCGKSSTACGIGKHKNYCYLNPKNLRLCLVCNQPVKDYKHTKTCSHACSNTYFRTGPDNPNWKEGGHFSSYRTTCFHYYGRKCSVCDETNVVMVHHIDKNKNNNTKENLIPLCPTHHYYLHYGFEHLIKNKIEKYLTGRVDELVQSTDLESVSSDVGVQLPPCLPLQTI